VLVAATAGASLRRDDAGIGTGEVGDQLVAGEHLRPDGEPEHRILAVRAVRKTTAAAAAVPRAKLLVRAEAREVAPPRIRDEDDVAAVTAVTAVGAAARNVLLAAEVDGAVAPASGDNRQSGSVVKHPQKRRVVV
jgi:hypothetical protein